MCNYVTYSALAGYTCKQTPLKYTLQGGVFCCVSALYEELIASNNYNKEIKHYVFKMNA